MISALFVALSLQYGLPSGLLSSLCYVESKYKVEAVHHDDGGEDSIGICQIKYSTAKALGFKSTRTALFDPKTNIKYAAIYLKHQISRYNSIQRGVIAYNRGNARSIRTSKYQQKVFRRWDEYKSRRSCSLHRCNRD